VGENAFAVLFVSSWFVHKFHWTKSRRSNTPSVWKFLMRFTDSYLFHLLKCFCFTFILFCTTSPGTNPELPLEELPELPLPKFHWGTGCRIISTSRHSFYSTFLCWWKILLF